MIKCDIQLPIEFSLSLKSIRT